MEDIALELARLDSLRPSDTLAYPRIVGGRKIKGPYMYVVWEQSSSGNWDVLRRTYSREDALAPLGWKPRKPRYVEMFCALTEEKIAETGRATPQLRELLVEIRREWFLPRGKRTVSREQLARQYVSIYRMCELPHEADPVKMHQV